MGGAVSGILGGAAGALGGALSNQKEGGKNAGNIFGMNEGQNADLANRAYQSTASAQQLVNANDATQRVQNDGIQGQLYGQGGMLSQALGQEQDLARNGFNLTDTDKTAYGEASGNIARQFGQNDQSLSQSLSDRGLSSSGVAGQQFSNSLGNKNEQLAGLQTQIAQNRMQMNQQRLAQTQQFVAQLGQGAQSAINAQHGQEMDQAGMNLNIGKYASGLLGQKQDQLNSNLEQEQQTQHGSNFSNALNGGIAGVSAGMGMSGGGGGMSSRPSNSSIENAGAKAQAAGSMW